MKWLIVLILISCGKHEEPSALDYFDSDGDQKLNYEENELDKYIAHIESLGTVKGIIKFKVDEKVVLNFNNKTDLESIVPKYMASNDSRIKNKEYFSEWTTLRILNPINLNALKQEHYNVVLQFENSSDSAEEVILVNGEFITSLGKWSPSMELSLNADDLKLLASGKGALRIKKKFNKSTFFEKDSSETIRSKTYRLFFDDGKNAQVYYVSHDLSFDDFQKHKGITAQNIQNEEEIFLRSHEIEKLRWYSRELSNGDKVLIYSNIEELWSFFKTLYTETRITIGREEGSAKNTLAFNQPEGAKIFMKIRPLSQITRTFVDITQEKIYIEGGGGGVHGSGSSRFPCMHYIRRIKQETQSLPDINDMLKNVPLMQKVDLNLEILENQDEKGVFWNLKLKNAPVGSKLEFSPTQSKNSILIGEINPRCPRRIEQTYQSNIEKELKFEVESYVEKIDDSLYNI